MVDFLDELKEAITRKRVTIGARETLRHLKTKHLKFVVVSQNCPEVVRKDIYNYTKLGNMKVEQFEGTGKQLGTFCGKPFPIATIGVLAETKK